MMAMAGQAFSLLNRIMGNIMLNYLFLAMTLITKVSRPAGMRPFHLAAMGIVAEAALAII